MFNVYLFACSETTSKVMEEIVHKMVTIHCMSRVACLECFVI